MQEPLLEPRLIQILSNIRSRNPRCKTSIYSNMNALTEEQTHIIIDYDLLDRLYISFYGATPVARPAAYTQTYATADKTHAAMTSAAMPAGGVGAAAGAWDTAANRDQAIAEFAALRADVIDVKNLANSIIDDLQALGFFQ